MPIVSMTVSEGPKKISNRPAISHKANNRFAGGRRAPKSLSLIKP